MADATARFRRRGKFTRLLVAMALAVPLGVVGVAVSPASPAYASSCTEGGDPARLYREVHYSGNCSSSYWSDSCLAGDEWDYTDWSMNDDIGSIRTGHVFVKYYEHCEYAGTSGLVPGYHEIDFAGYWEDNQVSSYKYGWE